MPKHISDEIRERSGITRHIEFVLKHRRYADIEIIPWTPSRRYMIKIHSRRDGAAGFRLTINRLNSYKLYVPVLSLTQDNSKILQHGTQIFDAVSETQKKENISVHVCFDMRDLILEYKIHGKLMSPYFNVIGIFQYISCRLSWCEISGVDSLLNLLNSFEPHHNLSIGQIKINCINESCAFGIKRILPARFVEINKKVQAFFSVCLQKTFALNLFNAPDHWTLRKLQEIVEYNRHMTSRNHLLGHLFRCTPNHLLVLANLVTLAIGQQTLQQPSSVIRYFMESRDVREFNYEEMSQKEGRITVYRDKNIVKWFPLRCEYERDMAANMQNTRWNMYSYIPGKHCILPGCVCIFGLKPTIQSQCKHKTKKYFADWLCHQALNRYIGTCKHIFPLGVTTETIKRINAAAEKRAVEFANKPLINFTWQSEEKYRNENLYCIECQSLYPQDKEHHCKLTFGRFLLKHLLHDPRLLMLIAAFAEDFSKGDLLPNSNVELPQTEFLLNYFAILTKNDLITKEHIPAYDRKFRDAIQYEYPELADLKIEKLSINTLINT